MVEIFGFLAAVILVTVVLLWRARRGGSAWRDAPSAWRTGRNPSKFDWRGGRDQNAATVADWKDRPFSREDGHGKDGGG